jgi:hypothetical protein
MTDVSARTSETNWQTKRTKVGVIVDCTSRLKGDVMNVTERAYVLSCMDMVVRSVTDEENGVFEEWLIYGIPDGSTYEDFVEYAKDDEQYKEWCILFSELISVLIAKGHWNKNGYTTEFFHKEDYK